MPYLRQYKRIPLSFRYPVADSVLNCTASEYNITYVMPELSSACLILTRVLESRFFYSYIVYAPRRLRSLRSA